METSENDCECSGDGDHAGKIGGAGKKPPCRPGNVSGRADDAHHAGSPMLGEAVEGPFYVKVSLHIRDRASISSSLAHERKYVACSR